MNDTNEPQEQRKDPADALADLAAQEPAEIVAPPEPPTLPADPTEALNRLAESEAASPAEGDLDTPERAPVDLEMAEKTGLAGRDAFQARRARSATIGGDETRASSAAYKRTMIPLLLVVGGLLILVGALSAWMLLRQVDTGGHSAALVLVTLVSFPLAALLVFGAWWFHRDVRGK